VLVIMGAILIAVLFIDRQLSRVQVEEAR